jgi:hypothetical protein
MPDARKVAKTARWYLDDYENTLRVQADPRNAELLQVVETTRVLAISDNEVCARVIDSNEGLAYAIVARDALEKAAAELVPDGEIIHNTPAEFLLAW